MTLVLFFNLFDIIISGQEILQNLISIVPFFILIIGSFFFKGSEKYYSFIYLFIGVCTILLGDSSASNLSGSVFLILSWIFNKNKKYFIFTIVLTIILLTLRGYSLKETPSNLLLTITAFIYIYIIFFIKLSNNLKSKPKNLSKKDYDRILLLSKGYTSKEICDILNISINPYSLNRDFKKIMKSYGCDNMFQFGIKMNKLDIIDFDES